MNASSWNTMIAWALAAAVTTGCTLQDFNPRPPQTATDKAASLEKTQCGPDVDETRLLAVMTGSAIESVEPLYTSSPDAKSGSETRLHGAVIRVRTSQGVTAQWLDRALECHSARRLLQHASGEKLASDPFWLPGRMVDIDAEPARDAFEVAVRGESTDDAQEILIRANAYVATNQRDERGRAEAQK
jgi:hypothetical protein